jgi:hypothetical protein
VEVREDLSAHIALQLGLGPILEEVLESLPSGMDSSRLRRATEGVLRLATASMEPYQEVPRSRLKLGP